MCDSAQLKEPLYKFVKQDSRNAAWLGNALGIQALENEGKYNTKNPGHAVGKAAQTAALMYLGGALGGGAAGDAVGGASAGIGAGAEMTAEEIAAQQAMAQLAQQAPQGLANTMESGAPQSGYTPSSLWNALKNANSGTPLSQNLLNYGKAAGDNAMNGGLLNQLTSGGGSGSKMMAAQQGLKMMFPEQQQYRAPPAQAFQGQQGPLPTMYERNSGPYGTSAGNSLGFTEEQKRKLRDMGYPI